MNTLTRKFTLHHNELLLYDRGMEQQEKRFKLYCVFFNIKLNPEFIHNISYDVLVYYLIFKWRWKVESSVY